MYKYISKHYTTVNFKFNPYTDCGNPKISSRRYNATRPKQSLLRTIKDSDELLVCDSCKIELLDGDKVWEVRGFQVCKNCYEEEIKW